MARNPHLNLSRRERQIMDLLYQHGRLGAAEVRDQLTEQPSYSAVRALLRVLEDKGHVTHVEEDQRYIYMPTVPAESAKKSALRHMLDTFFGGSTEQAMAALLDEKAGELSDEELKRLEKMIEKARAEGR